MIVHRVSPNIHQYRPVSTTHPGKPLSSADEPPLTDGELPADLTQTVLLNAYLRGRQALRRFLRIRTRDDSAADDLLQDLWLRARRTSSPQQVRDPAAFLRT